MVKVSFVQRPTGHTHWGGDLMVLNNFAEGLRLLGHEGIVVRHLEESIDSDFVFLSNICFDARPYMHFLQLHQKKFGVVGFYEDVLRYFSPCHGFYYFAKNILAGNEDLGYRFTIERLVENPSLIYYYPITPKKNHFVCYDVLKQADVCIASCPTEAQTLKRDCQSSNPHSILYRQNFAEMTDSDAFLKFAGLTSKEYVLQVGRFEPRKNQMATIMAMRDLPIPLVFIATQSFKEQEPYLVDCLQAIIKWRKAPTIVVSENISDHEEGHLKILRMPGMKKLSEEMLMSAFYHAGLLVHPAFYELPGSIYLEAARLGVPAIASEWTTIKDYFTDFTTGKYLLDERIAYTLPHDISKQTQLIEEMYQKSFSFDPDYPIFRREIKDMGQELLDVLQPLLHQ